MLDRLSSFTFTRMTSNLVALCVLSVVSVYIGVFLKRNKQYTTPFVLGTLYAFYRLFIFQYTPKTNRITRFVTLPQLDIK